MKKSLVQRAAEEFSRKNFTGALSLYCQLSEMLGEKCFAANIKICQKRLVGSLNSSIYNKNKNIIPSKYVDKRTDPSRKLRVLSLFDQFSEDCFRFDAELLPLDRANWETQVKESKADLFLAESVWRGNGETWNYCMTKFSSRHGHDLRNVLSACKQMGIPTVFWNKEDPANFEVFVEVAKEFDYVFTTDANCVSRYKILLGHDRVATLPFAAQPAMHNPVLKKSRNSRIAFAGSWSGRKYPARALWLNNMLGEFLKRGILDIYDRHSRAKDESLRFPERFKGVVHDALPYSDLSEQVYKSFAAMINVNSVEDSPSMVARRIYELAACGTPIISSPSPALNGSFEPIVHIVQDKSQIGKVLDEVLGDELTSLRRSTLGVRLVHGSNTYRHRLEEVCKVVGLPIVSRPVREVTALLVSKRPQFLKQIADMLNAQTYPHIKVVFVAHGDGFVEDEIYAAFDKRFAVKVLHLEENGTVLADGLNRAKQVADTDLLAKIDDDDYYGPNYLLDSVQAFEYTRAGLVGKLSHFCFVESVNQMALRWPSKHYRYVQRVHGGTLVWDRTRTGDVDFEQVRQGTDSKFLNSLRDRGVSLFSSDPFNYVHVRYANTDQHTWKIEDAEFLRNAKVIGEEGLDLGQANL